MKILPILRPLQAKGFNTETLARMSCSAMCLSRLRTGVGSRPVDPSAIEASFFGDDNETTQFFFQVHSAHELNGLHVLMASDDFLRKRAHQIDFDERYGALPCQASVLRDDLSSHHQFLVDGATHLQDEGGVPLNRMGDFARITSPIAWRNPVIEIDSSADSDLSAPAP